MNNIDIANGIVFQKLGISTESIDDGLTYQKKIYLLQSLGTDLGYIFKWIVFGPYSPSLNDYVYDNLEVLLSSDFSGYSLSSSAENNIDIVNSLSEDKRADLGIASWYELLASLLHIFNNKRRLKIDKGEDALFDRLIKYNPQYDKEQCSYAFSVLRKKGFIKLEV